MNLNRVLPRSCAAALIVCSAFLAIDCSSVSTVTILHTNDMHAAFVPHEAGWVRSTPKPETGGFDELWRRVDSIRQVRKDVLLLDAGDVMTGTPISELEYHGVSGGALFEMMNRIGYDAWTIGNHDLDISQANLRGLTGIATFPIVSANLVDSVGGFPFRNTECVIVEKGGVRIGIIGIMSSDLFQLTNTNNLKGLRVLPPVEVTQRLIDSLDPGTDLLVALTHQGVDDDSMLAASTKGLDVIIGGHSHTRLNSPKVINGVIICQAGSNAENLGELDMTVKNDRVETFAGKLVQLWPRKDAPPTPVSGLVKEYQHRIDSSYGEVLATLQSDWKRSRSDESPLGNFIADAIREGSGADLAVTNSSGIRKDLLAGPVTMLDLFELSPFRNIVTTFPIKGIDLRAFMTRQARGVAEGRGSLQLSGVSCIWKRGDGSIVIERILVGGKELVDDAVYTFATSDFLISQADKYLGFVPAQLTYSDRTIFQTMVDKARRDKILSAGGERRFQETP
jgi:2',3'-cyclic-nucleotide 2'-phosphodiesterase (5'-nucleotidase family)